MKRQGGFTLIELVVVIVILGILAVTAAPKFLNIQDDARKATLEGLVGAIKGSASLVYGKAAIAGLEGTSGGVSVAGTTVQTTYGYPNATSTAITAIVDGIGTDFKFIKSVTGNPPAVFFGISGYTGNCVKYTQAENATTPAKAAVVSTNCS
ncbi:type II secretion system protein [Vibrio sp. S9_S30]|uniref:type II secretion system protein n=1 Tax=Vibrio sp. S9_S30 TaxID=2720226 RepID=UPI0016809B4D|nr:type II secretion system protein [Vibrio sp. S9_S30]MBD1558970.1 type II secretion system protein [Vibrio sp. S9_S30]